MEEGIGAGACDTLDAAPAHSGMILALDLLTAVSLARLWCNVDLE
jgi:hypothetical protein